MPAITDNANKCNTQ